MFQVMQTITWTNDDPVHWRVYASSWLIELIYCGGEGG